LKSRYIDHITSSPDGDVMLGVTKNYPIDDVPPELDNKIYLLRHFDSYIIDRLYGTKDYTFEDLELKKGMVFVTRYLRMKHVIVFRLSNDILQVRFSSYTDAVQFL
jgi:hypothetical protein